MWTWSVWTLQSYGCFFSKLFPVKLDSLFLIINVVIENPISSITVQWKLSLSFNKQCTKGVSSNQSFGICGTLAHLINLQHCIPYFVKCGMELKQWHRTTVECDCYLSYKHSERAFWFLKEAQYPTCTASWWPGITSIRRWRPEGWELCLS